jgi:osmotically-inducible protein OsmY
MDTTSTCIEDDVRARIAGDPRIPYPAEIAVEVVDQIATLRGTVGSFAQRHAAVADARRTAGVEYVGDWLQVRLLDRDRREDAEIRGVALQRLAWDSEIPGDAIRVSVEDGWVTLEGDVVFQFQSDEAFNRIASLHGVAGVTNAIRVDERGGVQLAG